MSERPLEKHQKNNSAQRKNPSPPWSKIAPIWQIISATLNKKCVQQQI